MKLKVKSQNVADKSLSLVDTICSHFSKSTDDINLVDEKHCNNEGGSHYSSGMSPFPDFDMDMVKGHVVLSAKNKSKEDDDVDHLPWDKEEDEKKDDGKGDKIVCLVIEQVADNLP